MIAAGAGLLTAGCSSPRSGASPVPASVPPTTPAAIPVPSGTAAATAARSVPVSIVIPAIGVNAPVMQLGLNPDRTIQVPPLAARNLAGWYKYGPSPGQQGPAVIVGHIDSTAGGSVFFRLRYLVRGDRISIILADGRTVVFGVYALQQVPKTAFPTARVYGPAPDAELRLVTCGGVFDAATRSYLSDVIAYARRVP